MSVVDMITLFFSVLVVLTKPKNFIFLLLILFFSLRERAYVFIVV